MNCSCRTASEDAGSRARQPEPPCSVFSPQIARAAAASSLVYVVASVMASMLVAQRLRMVVAVHVTGCISVSAACVVLGCGTNALAPTGGGSLTAALWDAAPKTITDYWRLQYNIKTSCLSAAEMNVT